NDIMATPGLLVLALDDYHLIATQAIHDALAFLLEHMPPQMHLAIATREDPHLPLARLRARGQLAEVRAGDLRFSSAEAAQFLNQVMGLNLSAQDVAALERRTEGWIAGLQLAAVSMQGREDVTALVQSFAGSHRYVLDYLVEEVLEQQPAAMQDFVLQTSVLEMLTGALCNALTGRNDGQATLERLVRANLFIVPLDEERRWYRYHHLFADLLRQRLRAATAWPASTAIPGIGELHIRASAWYEANGLPMHAFHHAAAAGDVERAARLMEGEKLPVHHRSAVTPILTWLDSLPKATLDAYPSLRIERARMLLALGQTSAVEENLQAAEASLAAAANRPEAEWDDASRDLVGRMAALRATVALSQHQGEDIFVQSRRALHYLHPQNQYYRASTSYKLGYAYQLQGDWVAAGDAYSEALSISQESGDIFIQILATDAMGWVQAAGTQLFQAAESFQHVLELFADQPLPIASEAHSGLARILYEWNELDRAQWHGEQALELALQYESNIDIPVSCQVFLARLKLTRGELAGATDLLAQADAAVREHNFSRLVPEVTAARVQALLLQGDVAAAAELTRANDVPLSKARVYLAQGDASAALATLAPLREQAEAKNWVDQRLNVMILQALAYQLAGDSALAFDTLHDLLSLAEPGGYVRSFVDEGPPMARLLYDAIAHGVASDYVHRLLAKFGAAGTEQTGPSTAAAANVELIEPLSERELEFLCLIAEGLTNPEIASRLFLSLNTVKAHTRNIYGKLGVHNRTQAVARARALRALPSV
ncbi:MAG: LuxR C-terminal-related transcriptional regulator, partial [Anaerolineae bacterium]